MISAATQRLLSFLSDIDAYPHHPPQVTLVQTHASWVFIAPPFVYKIKQPVNLGFLDFSTLELRHAGCERDLVLNRRLAEDTTWVSNPSARALAAATGSQPREPARA